MRCAVEPLRFRATQIANEVVFPGRRQFEPIVFDDCFDGEPVWLT
jgi:hypothetical protein